MNNEILFEKTQSIRRGKADYYRKKYDTAFISAFKTGNPEYNEDAIFHYRRDPIAKYVDITKDIPSINKFINYNITKKLEHELQHNDYGLLVYRVTGFYIEDHKKKNKSYNLTVNDIKTNAEKSFFLVDKNKTGKLLNYVLELGNKYHQQNIYYKKAGDESPAYWVYTDQKPSSEKKVIVEVLGEYQELNFTKEASDSYMTKYRGRDPKKGELSAFRNVAPQNIDWENPGHEVDKSLIEQNNHVFKEIIGESLIETFLRQKGIKN